MLSTLVTPAAYTAESKDAQAILSEELYSIIQYNTAICNKNTHKPAELEGVGNQRVERIGRLNNRETSQPEWSSI